MSAKLATKVALKAVALGAEHIPDKVFESIPGGYYKPKKVREEANNEVKKETTDRRRSRRSRRSRRDSHASEDGYQSDYHTSGAESGYHTEARRSRERRYRPRAHSIGGDPKHHSRSQQSYEPSRPQYAQDGWDPVKDFGRPPTRYGQPQMEQDPYLPRPYNPADYANARETGSAPGIYSSDPSSRVSGAKRRSVAEQRYCPTDYTPSNPSVYEDYQRGSIYTPPYSAHMPPSNGVPYVAGVPPPFYRQPSYTQPPSPASSHGSSGRRRKSSSKRTASMPRSLSAVRQKFSNIGDDRKAIAATAAGAIAGGFLGHGVLKSDVGLAVGAVIGGMAARGWETRGDLKDLASDHHGHEQEHHSASHGRDDFDSEDDSRSDRWRSSRASSRRRDHRRHEDSNYDSY